MEPLSISNAQSAQIQVKLGNIWHVKGNFKEAMSRYQAALRLQPNNITAYQQLGNLMLKQRRTEEALEYYEQALSIDFEATDLSFYYQCLGLPKQVENIAFPTQKLAIAANRKINLGSQRVFGYHRSGWNFALQALSPLHNPQGVLFDGFLEHQFLFRHEQLGARSRSILEKMKADGVFEQLATSEEQGITPYQEPWIGFLHNPPAMPHWFAYHNSPQKLFEKQIWQDSLPHCLGLFALSEYHAAWLREHTGKPVAVLIHPTEIPQQQFDFNQFLANPHKKIVQIGWWLRKLHSIEQLPIAQNNALGYEKVRLRLPSDGLESLYLSFKQLEAKTNPVEMDQRYLANTTVIQHLSNHQYDELLATNIAFVDLYDASANNAVIECIARATPLLVNPLPAVKEYLGEEYPLYFNTLQEAAEKALDTSLILETHEYLKSCETRQKLSADYFLESFCNSAVYQNL